MKRVLKWLMIVLGGIVGLALLLVLGLYAYISYEKPKTPEQNDSLQMIKNLRNNPRPETFSEELSTDEPEIYDDRSFDRKSTAEGHLKP